MALVGINAVSEGPQKKDTLDKVATALQIAQGVLGTALAIPKFMQEKESAKLNQAESRTKIGQETEVAQPGEAGSFEVPGMGVRKPVPTLQRLIQEQTLAEKSRDNEAPTEADYLDLQSKFPQSNIETLKNLYRTRGDVKDAYNKALGATVIKMEDPFAREKFNYEKTKEGEKSQRERDEKFVPSLGQYALTANDAKETKEAIATKNSITRSVNDLIALRKKYGGGNVTNREDVARAQQLSTKLLLKYKKLETLGVLSKTDMELINNLVPQNPLEMNPSGIVGQDPTMAKLNQLGTFLDDDLNTFLESRGFQIGENNPRPNVKGVTKQEAENF